MITAITPGTNNPCANRHRMSSCRLLAVAVSSVIAPIANNDGTMTFLRPMDSATNPTNGAVSATDKVTAPTVRLTATSDA